LSGLALQLPQISDESWQSLLGLEKCEMIEFRGRCDIPPQRLRQLSQLPNLTSLSFVDMFNRQAPTVEQLQAVAELTQLKKLVLLGVFVNTESLAALKPLKLEDLRLTRTELDGVELEVLKGMTALHYLGIRETGLSSEAVAELRAALPDCTIHADFPPEKTGGNTNQDER
jgi:hypothetical protein